MSLWVSFLEYFGVDEQCVRSQDTVDSAIPEQVALGFIYIKLTEP